jgi:hypothetical protein
VVERCTVLLRTVVLSTVLVLVIVLQLITYYSNCSIIVQLTLLLNTKTSKEAKCQANTVERTVELQSTINSIVILQYYFSVVDY